MNEGVGGCPEDGEGDEGQEFVVVVVEVEAESQGHLQQN